MVASRTGLRGSRLVASASGTDSTATMTAYALTSRPAVAVAHVERRADLGKQADREQLGRHGGEDGDSKDDESGTR